MDLTQRRQRYRSVLAGDQCVHPASVFDPISARIAEDLGFEVGMLAGSIASGTVLGAPDLVVLTLSEFAQQIQRISRAGDLSLMVDADHGYGNALSVMRTVEELETAGVAALTIEDTVLPISFGGDSGEPMISLEEGVGKMKAALAARQDPNLVVAGRTSALRSAGIEETIRRVKAYEEAGVDAMFLAGARTREEIPGGARGHQPAVAAWWRRRRPGRPGIPGGQRRPHCPAGAPAFQAAVKAVHDTLTALREGVAPADLGPNLASAELMAQGYPPGGLRPLDPGVFELVAPRHGEGRNGRPERDG